MRSQIEMSRDRYSEVKRGNGVDGRGLEYRGLEYSNVMRSEVKYRGV